MPISGVNAQRKFAHLDDDECWRLVGAHGVGRVVFDGDSSVQIVPTSYDAVSGTAYFRAPVFGELARRVDDQVASLQVDEIDRDDLTGWSVLMTGTAHRVDDAATVASLWSLGRRQAWFPGLQTQWIALTVDTLRGQRVGV